MQSYRENPQVNIFEFHVASNKTRVLEGPFVRLSSQREAGRTQWSPSALNTWMESENNLTIIKHYILKIGSYNPHQGNCVHQPVHMSNLMTLQSPDSTVAMSGDTFAPVS